MMKEIVIMDKHCGVLIKGRKSLITLVNWGDVDSDLFNHILRSLQEFLHSLSADLEYKPEINIVQKPLPEIMGLGREEEVFSRELRYVGGKIVLGITDNGIYEGSRNIFGFGWSGIGLLSTYRFRKTPYGKMKERLGKEIIKIFGLAIDVWHCNQENCILSYHRHIEDLDYNHQVCEECRKQFIKNINQYMGD